MELGPIFFFVIRAVLLKNTHQAYISHFVTELNGSKWRYTSIVHAHLKPRPMYNSFSTII